MQPYQERVIQEREELKIKIESLHRAITDVSFMSKLPPDELDRLLKQKRIMDEYLSVLSDRINNFR
jgi:hypothetical protein